jgi:hypothetical protein
VDTTLPAGHGAALRSRLRIHLVGYAFFGLLLAALAGIGLISLLADLDGRRSGAAGVPALAAGCAGLAGVLLLVLAAARARRAIAGDRADAAAVRRAAGLAAAGRLVLLVTGLATVLLGVLRAGDDSVSDVALAIGFAVVPLLLSAMADVVAKTADALPGAR